MKHCLFFFDTTRDVVRAERAAKKYKIACRIIPAPRFISTECTMAIECPGAQQTMFKKVLSETGINIKKIY